VVDEFGDPLVNVTVRVLRRALVNGQRRLSPGSSAQTDDRGIYRFGTLTPGDYVVAIPSGTTSVPTSLVDQYQQTISMLGGAPDQQAAQQRLNVLMQDLNNSGAPIPSGSGFRLGDSQLQPQNALSRSTPPPTDAGRVLVYQTTFYPATATSSQAQVITLASGEERPGVDLQMRLVQTARVSGTLVGPNGPAGTIGIKLFPAEVRDFAGENGYETATTVTDGNGQFTFLGVPAGQYVLRAQKIPRQQDQFMAPMAIQVGGRGGAPAPPAQSGPPPIVEPTLWAEAAVTVGETDVANLNVAFRDGVRVSGRVEFDGTLQRPTPDRMQQITLGLNPTENRNAGAFQPTHMRSDGQFTSMEYLPGKYLATAGGSPGSGWVLKSITANGRDVTQMPLVLEAADITGVVITYTDTSTQLSGLVQSAGAGPETQGLIVIFPMNYQQWVDNGMPSRVMRQARTSKTGTYQVTALPAGDYFVAAIPDELSADWLDPAMLPAIVRVASRISVAEGEKKTLDLRISQVR
jgi:uncharacterized protein (DUF2141 family)